MRATVTADIRAIVGSYTDYNSCVVFLELLKSIVTVEAFHVIYMQHNRSILINIIMKNSAKLVLESLSNLRSYFFGKD